MLTAVAVVLAGVLVAGGVALGAVVGRGESSSTSAAALDQGFLRDMQAHHAQAVEMSVLVRESTDRADVRQLALDVMLTQQQQIGQMYGWLASRGLPQSTAAAPMSWMRDMEEMGALGGHAGHPAARGGDTGGSAATSMPGMATDAELEALERATGDRAAQMYLSLMIPHHLGGIAMAEAAAERAEDPFVRLLAGRMVQAQKSEVAALRALLDSYERPRDASGAGRGE
ncbi:DUF305 domain-containing protein [Nocardioides perillae]|uniref:Uncharacterized protein (DUF305 family) n=1 Tax=Nocardioides perillae TaxID=1119534 RepID=A0A7Y9RZ53_9ACTN|nr:uncharacterized protein (DUF305 family) [Nocardioides perillae]